MSNVGGSLVLGRDSKPDMAEMGMKYPESVEVRTRKVGRSRYILSMRTTWAAAIGFLVSGRRHGRSTSGSVRGSNALLVNRSGEQKCRRATESIYQDMTFPICFLDTCPTD